jgi:hypothetical protein
MASLLRDAARSVGAAGAGGGDGSEVGDLLEESA